jgi:hypothetical protein
MIPKKLILNKLKKELNLVMLKKVVGFSARKKLLTI